MRQRLDPLSTPHACQQCTHLVVTERTPGASLRLMSTRPREEPLRLADLLAAVSLATDLGMGLPHETALRVCLLATRLARRMALPSTR